MIYLEGFTASAATEVKSRAHCFKVYHTGNAFYFACASHDAMLAWIQLVHRATLLPAVTMDKAEVLKQFSETDYSETESDPESPDKRDRDRDREKDKSKFGSLKKLTHRGGRSDSHENVSHVGHANVAPPAASTSLDRKYLRFFSRAKTKDDSKSKSKQPVPVATEHYRSYRRAPPSPPAAAPSAAPRRPSPIDYMHASNPNLLDFESEFVTKPALTPRPRDREKVVGFVTLEEFMLRKQAEERRGAAAGLAAGGGGGGGRGELQRRLDRIVP
ncbi:unnamed protein product, partial [Leptidea sinapis]